jgi:hypothetical protein
LALEPQKERLGSRTRKTTGCDAHPPQGLLGQLRFRRRRTNVQQDRYNTTHSPATLLPVDQLWSPSEQEDVALLNVGDVAPRDQPRIPIAGNDLFNCPRRDPSEETKRVGIVLATQYLLENPYGGIDGKTVSSMFGGGMSIVEFAPKNPEGAAAVTTRMKFSSGHCSKILGLFSPAPRFSRRRFSHPAHGWLGTVWRSGAARVKGVELTHQLPPSTAASILMSTGRGMTGHSRGACVEARQYSWCVRLIHTHSDGFGGRQGSAEGGHGQKKMRKRSADRVSARRTSMNGFVVAASFQNRVHFSPPPLAAEPCSQHDGITVRNGICSWTARRRGRAQVMGSFPSPSIPAASEKSSRPGRSRAQKLVATRSRSIMGESKNTMGPSSA